MTPLAVIVINGIRTEVHPLAEEPGAYEFRYCAPSGKEFRKPFDGPLETALDVAKRQTLAAGGTWTREA